jgi:hypothetical protein
MNRPIRFLIVLFALCAAVVLALLPAGHLGQNRQGLFASFVGPSVALARIRMTQISGSLGVISTRPAFTHPPQLDIRGRKIVVQGHITCDPGDKFRIDVTVSQLATDELDGAIAKGHTRGVCTGAIQQAWVVSAKRRAGTVFAARDAQVCAVATTKNDGSTDDAFQWCKDEVLQ